MKELPFEHSRRDYVLKACKIHEHARTKGKALSRKISPSQRAIPLKNVNLTSPSSQGFGVIIEGSLNSKLPTIWRVGKADENQIGEVKSQERRVRRKKMQ